jgi:hypothetical protein
LKDSLACCHIHFKLNEKQQVPSDNEIKESGIIYAKCKDKNDLTCARFYEERTQAMLEIFSEVIKAFHHILIGNLKSRKVSPNLLQSAGEIV